MGAFFVYTFTFMKKTLRIKDTREFQRILNRRKFQSSSSFVIYTDKMQTPHPRFGISVPKKLGNAVLRNKTKRQVRSMIQEFPQIKGDLDVIVMVRKGYFNLSYDDNRKDLEKLMKTVKIV